MWDFSSLTRDWTHTPWIAMQILNHWTTREVPKEDSSDWKSFIFFQNKTFSSGNQKPMSMRHDWIQVFTWGGVYKLLSYIFHYVAFILRWVLPKWLCKWPAGTSRFTSRATSRKWKCLKKLYQLQKNPRADSDWLEQSHIFTPYQFPNSAQVCLAMWITCPPREPEDEVSSKVFIWAENGEQTSL